MDEIIRTLGIDSVEEVIRNFEREKITPQIVLELTRTDLSNLGVRRIGDQCQLESRCRASLGVAKASVATAGDQYEYNRTPNEGKSGGRKRRKARNVTMQFLALSDTATIRSPSQFTIKKLTEAGLGEKRMVINAYATPEEVREAILETYPKLKDAGGFEYLKANSSSKELEPVPLPPEGFGAYALKTLSRQARVYLRPVQCNLNMSSIAQQINTAMELKEECKKCNTFVPQTHLRMHVTSCSKGTSSINERFDRLQSLEGPSTVVIADPATAASTSTQDIIKDMVHSAMMHEVSSSSTEQQQLIQAEKETGGVKLEYVQEGDVVYMYPATSPHQDSAEDSDDNMEEEDDEDGGALFQLLEEVDECHPEGGICDVPLEDLFDVEDSTDSAAAQEEEVDQSSFVDVKDLAGGETFLGYTSSLQQLLGEIPVSPCPMDQCGCVPQTVTKTIGTALTVKWVCKNGHVSKTWSSQPKIRSNFAGDVALSSAIVLSGSNLPKVRMLCRCLNLGACTEALHDTIQRECTFPAVTSYWERVQKSVLDGRRDKEITIAAGTRSDTCEQSYTYSPYTSLDYTTGDILNITTIDKRKKTQQDHRSLEMEAFTQTMDLIKNNGIKVKEVVTHEHKQLKDYMSQQPSILHSFDVWLGAKNVGRKVAMASQRSEFYRPLELWTTYVTKHFLHCSERADGENMQFIAYWRGILHHVVGDHEWPLGDCYGSARCSHDPIPKELEQEEQEKLLQPGSLSHVALREIVLHEQLLWNVGYYTRNRHMRCLERFWPYLDAYVDDHVTYSHSSYKARNLLAAIDFQLHKDRSQQTRNGLPVFKRQYNSRTKKRTKVPVLEKKSYSYIPDLMKEIFMKSLVKYESSIAE